MVLAGFLQSHPGPRFFPGTFVIGDSVEGCASCCVGVVSRSLSILDSSSKDGRHNMIAVSWENSGVKHDCGWLLGLFDLFFPNAFKSRVNHFAHSCNHDRQFGAHKPYFSLLNEPQPVQVNTASMYAF